MDQARVLVVEDELLVRELLVEVLTEAGFEVDEAGTGDEAEDLIDRDGYRLLLTDVHMPGKLDGIDLAAHAREKKPGIPVVFVTGRPDALSKFSGSKKQVAFMEKPYSPDQIIEVVRQLLSLHGV